MRGDMSKETRFSKENQPKRGRGKSDRTKILEAMKRQGKSEDGFFDLMVERAHDPEDTFAFKEMLSRLAPIPKATLPLVKFDFDKNAKPHEKADQVITAIADGVMPPDIATILITSIKAMIDIEEGTELKERIEKLEAALNGES